MEKFISEDEIEDDINYFRDKRGIGEEYQGIKEDCR